MILGRIDDAVLGACEWFSHFMQRTFGTRAADLERATLVAAILFLLRDSYLSLGASKVSTFVRGIGLVLNAFMILWYGARFQSSYDRQRQSEQRTLHGLMNPAKHLSAQRVVYLVVCCIVFPADLLRGSFWFECSGLAMYFEAIDDLPPGVSRVRKLIDSLSTPAPVPVST
jgi:hypothetical protein